MVNLEDKVQVVFEFPRESLKGVDGIEDAFASQYKWKSRIGSEDEEDETYLAGDEYGTVDNPETKEQFAVRKIQEYVGEVWKSYNQKKLDKAAAIQHAASINLTNEAVKAATTTSVI